MLAHLLRHPGHSRQMLVLARDQKAPVSAVGLVHAQLELVDGVDHLPGVVLQTHILHQFTNAYAGDDAQHDENEDSQ